MLVRELRPRPPSWSKYRENRPRWVLPLRALEWALQWSAYFLSRWAFLEVLEYLSVLSVFSEHVSSGEKALVFVLVLALGSTGMIMPYKLRNRLVILPVTY